jgi:phosphohistidine phosphatase
VQERIADMPLVQIWASPLVRAQQTAEIALSYFPGLKIQTTDLLVPEANPQVLMNWLDKLNAQFIGTDRSLLLVSHQPLVGALVNLLCGKPGDYYPMGTSSLAAIRAQVVAADMGDLLWLDHA